MKDNKINNDTAEGIKNYPGAKSGAGVYQNIINNIPKHDIYIEGFLGSGAILRNKLPAETSICLDLNDICIDNGRKNNIPEVIYKKCDAVPFLDSYNTISSILRNIGKISMIYLDPPYLKITRRTRGKIYRYEYDTSDHIRLIDVIRSSRDYVMISSYRNELYDDMLKGWRRVDFPSVTRKGLVTESIYMNYEKPLLLHDFRYIGKDFRERERNRGIINRNISKLKRLPLYIRRAILQELH